MKLHKIIDCQNIAEKLDEDQLRNIGSELMDGYAIDESSREEWVRRTEDYIRLATQLSEEKSFPWPNAANVNYPMLTTAAIQFSSRAYPALVQGNNPIKVATVGYDPTGAKTDQADRISKHMGYQLLHQMTEWEEDMDRLLMNLSIVGTGFKKTYFCPIRERNVSEHVSPLDLTINYYAKSVDQANRKFHKMSFYRNEVIEKIRGGNWIDFDLDSVSPTDDTSRLDTETQGLEPVHSDEDAPIDFLEAHCYLDLDEDGYKEPYIVTIAKATGEVVRIYRRFSEADVSFNERGQVSKITPVEYFTGYVFIPDPASNIYGLGFGHLLGPLNDTANTLINQLLDSGTLANTGGGFLGRSFKLRNMGDLRFKPGEWKTTTATGDDLRKSIFPLPVRDPSPTLFNLLGTIIDSGQKLSSTMDIMMGESPGQNQPATTTMAVLEQGLKVFTSIHKRVYRSFKSELKKLFRLNAEYLDPEEYFRILDYQESNAGQGGNSMMVRLEDYKQNLGTVDITPAGDPNVVTQTQKLLKAEALLQLMGSGMPLNQDEVRQRVLEAQEQPNIQALLQVPPPQPDPELVMKQQELDHKINIENRQLELDIVRVSHEAVKDESQGILSRVKAEGEIRKQGLDDLKSEMEAANTQVDIIQKMKNPPQPEMPTMSGGPKQ